LVSNFGNGVASQGAACQLLATMPLDQSANRRRWIVAGVLLFVLALRIAYARNYRIDSDEPQHLHVVWGWTQGMLPYRDFFDNHMPLFHVLSAPIFHLLGVRPDIVVPMRLFMNLLFAFNLWCVWKIASRFFSVRDALIGTGLVMLWPAFFFESLEYRPDDLWTSFWLLSLWLTTSATITRPRAFVIGLTLGAALVVSMKSVLVLAALLLASVLTYFFVPTTRQRFFSRYPVVLTVGLTMPFLLTASYFIAHEAGRQFFYCTIQHNIIFRHDFARTGWRVLKALCAIAIAIALTRFLTGSRGAAKAPSDAAFVLLAVASYLAILQSCWTTLSDEDYLPFWPSLGAVVAPWISQHCSLGRIKSGFAAFIAVGPLAAELFFIIAWQAPWCDKAAPKIGFVADALRLTSPQDYLIDGKGETIYRHRPVYWVYESLTFDKIGEGIADDLIEKLIVTKTPVASMRRLPDDDEGFVEANYLPVAFRLRALGKMIYIPGMPSDRPPSSIVFEVAIPNRYMIVAEQNEAEGTLDGTPLHGPRELPAGQHLLQLTSGHGRVALIWAQAIEHGYQPFRAIQPDIYDATD
jgi:hypothetical protein